MKAEYKVFWTKTAEDDLLKIIDYIAQDNLSSALENLEKIKNSVEKLSMFPLRCRILPELLLQGIVQYREMIVRPWRIIYKIEDTKVFVLSVLNSKQNLEDILLKRLLMF